MSAQIKLLRSMPYGTSPRGFVVPQLLHCRVLQVGVLDKKLWTELEISTNSENVRFTKFGGQHWKANFFGRYNIPKHISIIVWSRKLLHNVFISPCKILRSVSKNRLVFSTPLSISWLCQRTSCRKTYKTEKALKVKEAASSYNILRYAFYQLNQRFLKLISFVQQEFVTFCWFSNVYVDVAQHFAIFN